MEIKANEIASVEEIGTLNDLPVRLIKLKGGFWVAVSKPKGRPKEEAIAVGNHPAIVRFHISKRFSDFRPSLMKSEFAADNSVVDKHSHFLTDELRKSGHDIYSVQNGSDITFSITKHDLEVGSAKGSLEKDCINMKELKISKQFTKAMAGATAEKATSCGLLKVKMGK